MNSKMYETQFNLAAKVAPSFNKSFKYASNQVKALEKSTKSSKGTFQSFSGVLKAVGVAALAYKGLGAVSQFIKDSTNEAKVDIEMQTKLQTVLKQRTNATDAQIRAIVELTNKEEQFGVIAGSVQVAGAQQLATFISNTKSVEALLPAMNNLIAQQKGLTATEQDAVNVGNMMGKVLGGQIGALTRVGITFTKAQEKVLKYGTESERAAMLAKVITDNVGKMNSALLETDSGKIQNARLQFENMQSEIGSKILPMKAKLATLFVGILPQAQKVLTGAVNLAGKAMDYVINNMDSFKKALDFVVSKAVYLKNIAVKAFFGIKAAIAAGSPELSDFKTNIILLGVKLTEIFNRAKPAIEWFIVDGLPIIVSKVIKIISIAARLYNFISSNWSIFEPIIIGIVGAFIAFKTIMGALIIIVKTATLVSSGLGGAIGFLTSPIGLVVIAIGVLIAAGVAIYKNWDVISAKLLEIWEGVKANFIAFKDNIVGIWVAAYSAITTTFSGIGDFFSGIFGGAFDVIKGYLNIYVDVLNFMIRSLNKIQVNIPDWVPGIGGKQFGIAIKEIPKFAAGTANFKGGLAFTGERGVEIAQYPKGTKIHSNNRTQKILEKMKAVTEIVMKFEFKPQIIINGNANEKDIEKAMDMSQQEFERRLEAWARKKRRLQFAP